MEDTMLERFVAWHADPEVKRPGWRLVPTPMPGTLAFRSTGEPRLQVTVTDTVGGSAPSLTFTVGRWDGQAPKLEDLDEVRTKLLRGGSWDCMEVASTNCGERSAFLAILKCSDPPQFEGTSEELAARRSELIAENQVRFEEMLKKAREEVNERLQNTLNRAVWFAVGYDPLAQNTHVFGMDKDPKKAPELFKAAPDDVVYRKCIPVLQDITPAEVVCLGNGLMGWLQSCGVLSSAVGGMATNLIDQMRETVTKMKETIGLVPTPKTKRYIKREEGSGRLLHADAEDGPWEPVPESEGR